MGFALRQASRRWRRHVIPFIIQDSIREDPEDLEAVNIAIDEWNRATCLSLRPKLAADEDFVEFVRHPGFCQSVVGRQGGRQEIRCNFITNASNPLQGKAAIVLHEIGHAAGLLHEHQRPDRDFHVVVSAQAVQADPNAFAILRDDDVVAGVQVIGAYDCQSITHYTRVEGFIAGHPNGCNGLRSGEEPRLTDNDRNTVTYLYGYVRRRDSGDEALGDATEVAIVNIRRREFITALAGEGPLRLICWSVDDDGRFSSLGDSGSQAGHASHIDIARGANQFVVACTTNEGRLRLINWAVTGDGDAREIERRGDSGDQAGTATLNRIVALGDDGRFVTASRTAEGTLKLIGWRLNDDDTVERLADSGDQAGKVDEVSLAILAGNPVTAVRSANGKLKVIHWRWNPSSTTIDRLDEAAEDLGPASLIRSIVTRSPDRLFVSFRTASGRLRLAAWSRPPFSGLTFVGDSGDQAGPIEANALGVEDSDTIVSVVRTEENTLRLITWNHELGGIARVGDSGDEGGAVAPLVAVSPAPLRRLPFPPFNAPFVVSCGKRASGGLELISWSPCGTVGGSPDTDPTREAHAEELLETPLSKG
jgi:hypothetical protein